MEATCNTMTASGQVSGFIPVGQRCHVFRGIPYAQAKRLEKPEPVEPWLGTRCCHRCGPACPQPIGYMQSLGPEGLTAYMLEWLCPPLPAHQDYSVGNLSEEGCLNLNIFTPSLSGKRPVMIFIHGGGFMNGSNSEMAGYDGTLLAEEKDVVVININYRLGPFGFMHFPGHGITNLGIRDQIAALHWVQTNVANFGGDPGNVTIFGESAGGTSVCVLLQSPLARGLFHRAILMSHGDFVTDSIPVWEEVFQVLQDIPYVKKDVGDSLTPERFRNLSVATVVKWGEKTFLESPFMLRGSQAFMWKPLRGDDVLPAESPEALLSGAPPILTGHMAKEFDMLIEICGAFAAPSRRRQVTAWLKPLLKACIMPSYLKASDTLAEEKKWQYFADRLFDEVKDHHECQGLGTSVQEVCGTIASVAMYYYPSYVLARTTGCFSYVLHGPADERAGSGHARDVFMLFRYHTRVFQSHNLNGHPFGSTHELIGQQLREAFTTFAKNGVPEVKGLSWKQFPHQMYLQEKPSLEPGVKELIQKYEIFQAEVRAYFMGGPEKFDTAAEGRPAGFAVGSGGPKTGEEKALLNWPLHLYSNHEGAEDKVA